MKRTLILALVTIGLVSSLTACYGGHVHRTVIINHHAGSVGVGQPIPPVTISRRMTRTTRRVYPRTPVRRPVRRCRRGTVVYAC